MRDQDGVTPLGPETVPVVGNHYAGVHLVKDMSQAAVLDIYLREETRGDLHHPPGETRMLRIPDRGAGEGEARKVGEFFLQKSQGTPTGSNHYPVPVLQEDADYRHTPGGMPDTPVEGTDEDGLVLQSSFFHKNRASFPEMKKM